MSPPSESESGSTCDRESYRRNLPTYTQTIEQDTDANERSADNDALQHRRTEYDPLIVARNPDRGEVTREVVTNPSATGDEKSSRKTETPRDPRESGRVPAIPARPSTDKHQLKLQEKATGRPGYVMLVMGAAGTGKSTFIAAATKKDVPIGHALQSCTSRPEGYQMICQDGACVTLVDTPGFNQDRASDLDVLQSIIDFLISFRSKVIAVIYLHRIVENRITGSAMMNLRLLRAICGEHFFQNIALVTSSWMQVPPDSQEATDMREVELNSSTTFWADIIQKGGQYHRWAEINDRGHFESARTIVESCRSVNRAPLMKMMMELQDGRALEETSAGQLLTEELRKRLERAERERAEEEQETLLLQQEKAQMERKLRDARADLQHEVQALREDVRRQEGRRRKRRSWLFEQGSGHGSGLFASLRRDDPPTLPHGGASGSRSSASDRLPPDLQEISDHVNEALHESASRRRSPNRSRSAR